MKTLAWLAGALLVGLFVMVPPAAAVDPKVTLSVSGGVTFPAGNPTLQPVTPASTTLVTTIVIDPQKNKTWSLAMRSAGSSFTSALGGPIAVGNVQWAATATQVNGNGSVTVLNSSGTLSTSNVTIAFGEQGNKAPQIIQVTFTFTINNSWTYDAATYLQNLVLTATAN